MKTKFLLLLCVFSLFACKKNDTNSYTVVLSKTTLELAKGGEEILTATSNNPADGIMQWTSSDPTKVTVDANGKVTGLKAGITNITATYGGKSATCVVTVNPDVYVVSFENTGTTYISKLWKNGVATIFGKSVVSIPYSIFVSGSDVYVAGVSSGSGGWNATVWKNGDATILSYGSPSISAYARSVFATVAGDVYVTGHDLNTNTNTAVPKVWKNRDLTMLPYNRSYAYAESVSVSANGDVYVVGYDDMTAKLWKNGIVSNIGTNHASAYSVFVSGNDVYVAGRDYVGTKPVANIWKNGIATNLTSGTNAYSVFVSGTDVYSAGNELVGTQYIPSFCKNKTVTNLSKATIDARGSSIAVWGNDVYVVGYESNGTHTVAKLWKNGIATELSDGTYDAKAPSIFLVE